MLVPLRPVDGTGSSGMVVVGETEVVVYEVGMAGRKIGSPKVVKSSPRIDKGKRRESIEGGDATKGMPGSVDKGKRRRKSSTAGADGATGLSGSRGVTGKMPFATTTAYAVLDSNDKHTRILLGDSYGQLSLVTLHRSSGRVKTLDFLVLGEIPPPTTLTYLSSSHLFIGSHFGDSLILSLLPSPAPYSGSYLAPPLLAFNNLAPIVDFHKAEGEGGKLVTCSGGMNKGSLRVVRSGVGLEEEGILEGIEGVEGVWSLGEGQDG
jgi:DNA damage-binding protein 1